MVAAKVVGLVLKIVRKITILAVVTAVVLVSDEGALPFCGGNAEVVQNMLLVNFKFAALAGPEFRLLLACLTHERVLGEVFQRGCFVSFELIDAFDDQDLQNIIR